MTEYERGYEAARASLDLVSRSLFEDMRRRYFAARRNAVTDWLQSPEAEKALAAALYADGGRTPPPIPFDQIAPLFQDGYRQRARAILAALRGEKIEAERVERGCGCTVDAELAAGSVCPACHHRDHGASGCREPVQAELVVPRYTQDTCPHPPDQMGTDGVCHLCDRQVTPTERGGPVTAQELFANLLADYEAGLTTRPSYPLPERVKAIAAARAAEARQPLLAALDAQRHNPYSEGLANGERWAGWVEGYDAARNIIRAAITADTAKDGLLALTILTRIEELIVLTADTAPDWGLAYREGWRDRAKAIMERAAPERLAAITDAAKDGNEQAIEAERVDLNPHGHGCEWCGEEWAGRHDCRGGQRICGSAQPCEYVSPRRLIEAERVERGGPILRGHDPADDWAEPERGGPVRKAGPGEDALLQWVNRVLTVEGAKQVQAEVAREARRPLLDALDALAVEHYYHSGAGHRNSDPDCRVCRALRPYIEFVAAQDRAAIAADAANGGGE